MRALRITGCRDSLLWYAQAIGQTFSPVRDIPEGYLTRDNDGYTNIVKRDDAEVFELGVEEGSGHGTQ